MVLNGQLLVARLQLPELGFSCIFRVDDVVIGLGKRADDFVEFDLGGSSVSVLGVLNEKYHQERHDRGTCVDGKLPGVGKAKERPCQGPHDNHRDRGDKGEIAAGDSGDSVRKPSEELRHWSTPHGNVRRWVSETNQMPAR